jgi:copper(I)-binding protein
MVSETSAAQWLADHVGADWLNVTRKSNDVVGTNFLVTLRFNKDYCQSLMKLHCDYSSHAELHQTLIKHISQMRDEFFLLNMHALPNEEGVELETRSRK